MDAPADGAIGGTYVGNPVSIAAAHAVLDVIEEERPRRARGRDRRDDPAARMESWRERFDCVGDVRGLGAMLAIELVRDRDAQGARRPTSRPRSSRRRSARGLLLLKAGLYGNCIRVLVPLVITDEQLDEALGAWEEALEAASSRS